MSNESTYAEFIREKVAKEGPLVLNPDWVVKMLEQIEKANKIPATINPEYLRAEKAIWWAGDRFPDEPWMYKKL